MPNILSERNLLKIVKIGLYLALIVPFLTLQKFMFPFITSKVFGFNILIEVILAFWLALIILYPAYRPKLKNLSIILLAFFGVLLVSSALGLDFWRSLWSTQERAIGLFSLFHYLAFFFTLSVFKKEDWVKYLKFSVLVSVIMSVFAILQLYNSDIVLKNSGAVTDRPGSFLGNSSFLATYLVFNIFLALWFSFKGFVAKTGKNLYPSLFLVAGLFEMAILVFLTETRGAMLGFFVGFLFLLSYFAFKKESEQKTLKKYSAYLIAAIAIFMVVFFITKSSTFWQKVPGLNRLADISLKDNTAQTRLIVWNSSLGIIKERPILGYGWENFKYPFDKNYDPRLMRFGFSETYWDKPHNVLLEQAVAGGLLGLLVYLGVFIASIRILLKGRSEEGDYVKPFIAAILIAYFIQNIFLFDTFISYLMFFMILAFINSNFYGHEEAVLPGEGSIFRKKIIAVILFLAALAPIYVNGAVLYANNRHYWMANYYANDLQDKAIESYHSARDNFNPYLDQAYADFGSLTADIYTQGKLQNSKEVLKEAISAIDAAIGLKPNDFAYYLGLASAATAAYDLSPKQLSSVGEAALRKAYSISPNRQQIYYTHSKLKLTEGKKDEALDLLKKAVDLDPLSGDPHFIYGLLLLEVKESEKGIVEITKAEELGRGPRTGDEFRILGNYYGDLGFYDKSIVFYKKALVLNPEDLDAGLKLGIVNYYAGRKSDAIFMFSQILNGMPEFKETSAYKAIEPILKDLGL